jgi:hypothetical protein
MRRPVLPLVLLALGAALVVAPIGAAQTSFLAFVKALSHGTPSIDAYHWWTVDLSWWNDHYYSNKAPGLAFLLLPLQLVVHGLGLQPANPAGGVPSLAAATGVDPMAIWPLTLLGATATMFVVLLLVRGRAERVEPGYGTAAAVTVGAGTLLLPFSTLLFDHMLSALLSFAAFVVLWREREHPERLVLVGLGGLLAGLAIVSEYPTGLVAVILGAYALSQTRTLRRAGAYAGGVLVGVLPLLAFDRWAFGSPFHLSYVHAVSVTGNSGHDHIDANSKGFFGVSVPSPRVALELLFQHRGLLAISPVLALAVLGLVVMARRGFRAEALTIAAIALAFLVYDAGYYLPYGGDASGPRFLIPTLPFLGVALASAYRVARATTAALALASVLMMLAATSAPPLGNDDTLEWARRAGRNDFGETLLSHLFGWHGIAAFWPVLALVLGALALGWRTLPAAALRRRDLEIAGFALLAWGLVMPLGSPLLRTPAGAVATALVVAALTLSALALARRGPVGALPVLLLVVVAAGLYREPGWTLVLAAVVTGVLAFDALRRRPRMLVTATTSPESPGS